MSCGLFRFECIEFRQPPDMSFLTVEPSGKESFDDILG
jgi:hypothetical protein